MARAAFRWGKGYWPPLHFLEKIHYHTHIGGASPLWISETTILHPLAPLSKCSPDGAQVVTMSTVVLQAVLWTSV